MPSHAYLIQMQMLYSSFLSSQLIYIRPDPTFQVNNRKTFEI